MNGITLEQRDQAEQYLNDTLGLAPELMVETAGAGVATLVWSQLPGSLIHLRSRELRKDAASISPRANRLKDDNLPIGVLAGPGYTGAVALVAARRLLAWGARPSIHLGVPRDGLRRLNQAEVDRLEQLGCRVFEPGAPLPTVTLWLDGLFGTGFRQEIADELKDLIDAVNHDHQPTLAVDLPSGLEPTTGRASLPSIRADVTAALGLPLVGVLKPFAAQLVGELILIDLGIPASVWRRVGVTVIPSFDGKAFVKWREQ